MAENDSRQVSRQDGSARRPRRRRIILIKIIVVSVVIVLAGAVGILGYYRATTTNAQQVLSSTSPDGRLTAVVEMVQRHELPLPGPEPPRTTAQYHTLHVLRDGKIVFTLPKQDLGGSYGIGHFIDLEWSPDSSQFAYRLLDELLVVEPQGARMNRFTVEGRNAHISSFRWISDSKLIVLTKAVAFHIGPYPTYIEEASGVDLWLLDTGQRRWQHVANLPTKNVTYLFRSATFRIDELSPSGSRAAFFDGTNLVIYDYANSSTIVQTPVSGSVEGVWWVSKDRCLIAVNTLSGARQFFTIAVPNGKITEVTSQLAPLWTGQYDNLHWFAPILSEKPETRDAS